MFGNAHNGIQVVGSAEDGSGLIKDKTAVICAGFLRHLSEGTLKTWAATDEAGLRPGTKPSVMAGIAEFGAFMDADMSMLVRGILRGLIGHSPSVATGLAPISPYTQAILDRLPDVGMVFMPSLISFLSRIVSSWPEDLDPAVLTARWGGLPEGSMRSAGGFPRYPHVEIGVISPRRMLRFSIANRFDTTAESFERLLTFALWIRDVSHREIEVLLSDAPSSHAARIRHLADVAWIDGRDTDQSEIASKVLKRLGFRFRPVSELGLSDETV